MTTSDLSTTPPADATPAQFADRVMASVLGSFEVLAIYLGDRLGWYAALRDHGPLASGGLAARTGTVERYAREWLEHQAAAGYLVVAADGDASARDGEVSRDDAPHPGEVSRDDAPHPGAARRYALPAGAAEVLADPDSQLYLAPLSRIVAASSRALDPLLDAYRHGGGVSWAQLGVDAREAQATANRPLFLHDLSQRLLPGVPELHARLSAGATVADVGCGEGWSSVGVALGYPGTTVHGLDVDEPSVTAARRHAEEAGVADRVTFTHVDAGGAELEAAGPYDVVAAYECVHDMPDPVAVLRTMRRLAGAAGYVLVVDERAAETFTAPADPVERLLYGYSILVCLPDGLSHEPSVGTGTVMRPSVLSGYATAAGFSRVEALPVEHELFRFYRLHH